MRTREDEEVRHSRSTSFGWRELYAAYRDGSHPSAACQYGGLRIAASDPFDGVGRRGESWLGSAIYADPWELGSEQRGCWERQRTTNTGGLRIASSHAARSVRYSLRAGYCRGLTASVPWPPATPRGGGGSVSRAGSGEREVSLGTPPIPSCPERPYAPRPREVPPCPGLVATVACVSHPPTQGAARTAGRGLPDEAWAAFVAGTPLEVSGPYTRSGCRRPTRPRITPSAFG